MAQTFSFPKITFSFHADSSDPDDPAGEGTWTYPAPGGGKPMRETARFASFEDAQFVDRMLRSVFELGVQTGEERLGAKIKAALR